MQSKRYIDETIRSYDLLEGKYQSTHTPNIEFYKTEFDKFIKLIKGNKVLEIGCAEGAMAPLFQKAGFQYIGIDAAKNSIEVARKNYPKSKFKIMDFYKLSFPENSFGGFWETEALLHAAKEDIVKILKGIRKIIVKDSIGFMSFQEMEPLTEGERGALEEGVITKIRQGKIIRRYQAFYSEQELRDYLKQARFEVIEIERKEKRKGFIFLCIFVRAI